MSLNPLPSTIAPATSALALNAFSSTVAVTGQPEAAPLALSSAAGLLAGAALVAAALVGAAALEVAGAEAAGVSESEQPARAVAASRRLGIATGSANRIFTCGMVGPGCPGVESAIRHLRQDSAQETIEPLDDQRMVVRLRQS